jgi:hypothetical protein
LDDEILKKINDWLTVVQNLNYKKWEILFVFKEKLITNIVLYDWEKIIPKKKL